jgi:hypothetical protein
LAKKFRFKQLESHFYRSLIDQNPKPVKTLFLICSLLVWLPFGLQAQTIDPDFSVADTAQYHLIYLDNGDQFMGRVVSISEEEVTFLFNDKVTLHFPLDEVRRIKVLEDKEFERDYHFEQDLGFVHNDYRNLGAHALLYSPSAYGMEKGKVSYQNYLLFGNSIEYGASDHFTFGGSVVPLIFVNSLAARLKYSTPFSERVQFGVTLDAIGVFPLIALPESVGALIPTASLAIGDREGFVNFNAGYFYGFSNFGTIGFPFAGVGGEFNPSERWRLGGDVFIPALNTQGPLLVNFGASWVPNENRIDFGFLAVTTQDFFLPLPFLGYSVAF